MPMIKTYDGAGTFRVEVIGRLAGDAVDQVARYWTTALSQTVTPHFTIDISRLTGYDSAGRKLLSKMYHHGANIAAKTPSSLVFLGEISTPLRRLPAVVQTMEEKRAKQEPEAVPPRRKTVGQ